MKKSWWTRMGACLLAAVLCMGLTTPASAEAGQLLSCDDLTSFWVDGVPGGKLEIDASTKKEGAGAVKLAVPGGLTEWSIFAYLPEFSYTDAKYILFDIYLSDPECLNNAWYGHLELASGPDEIPSEMQKWDFLLGCSTNPERIGFVKGWNTVCMPLEEPDQKARSCDPTKLRRLKLYAGNYNEALKGDFTVIIDDIRLSDTRVVNPWESAAPPEPAPTEGRPAESSDAAPPTQGTVPATGSSETRGNEPSAAQTSSAAQTKGTDKESDAQTAGQNDSGASFIPLIVVLGIVVAGGAGAAVYIILRKRKGNAPEGPDDTTPEE